MVRIPSVTRRGDHADRDERVNVDERRVVDHDRKDVVDDEHDRARGRTYVTERPMDATATAEPVVMEQPVRARASVLATFGLILGVLAAAAVATGVLAVAGVALGLLAVLVSVAGLAATARPHVAGRFDAMLGLLLSLAAVIVGLLALGNAIPWPETDSNQVASFADWLRSELPWLDRF